MTEEAIYNEKVDYVLEALAAGKSRKDLADEYDYSNWKSLDMYMRRKNFRYDSEKGTYVPDVEEDDPVPTGAESKVAMIISLFQDDSTDPKKIAQQLGFADHRELAQYMSDRGYTWSSEKENYVREKQSKEANTEDSSSFDAVEEESSQTTSNLSSQQNTTSDDLLQYLPLLQKLAAKEEELDRLLAEGSKDGQVPKYAVPGASMTKSTYMSQRLAQLLEEFSDVKNVSQREIVEAALVEYFKSYGFDQEVQSLLS